MQDAANQIINENRRLRKLHSNLTELVTALFDVDLVKQQAVWKDKMDQIRRNVEAGA